MPNIRKSMVVKNRFYERFLNFIKIFSIALIIILLTGFFSNQTIDLGAYKQTGYFGYPFAWLSENSGAKKIITQNLALNIMILLVAGYLLMKIRKR